VAQLAERSLPTPEVRVQIQLNVISILTFAHRNNGFNELQNLKYLPRAMIEREIVFEDRTPAHADHVGFGFERKTTAAVGELAFAHPVSSYD